MMVLDSRFKMCVQLCIILPFLMVVATGCIVVRDFGEYWEKGSVDPELVGKWSKTDSHGTFSYEIEGDYLRTQESGQSDEYTKTKTLTLGAHKFIMMKNSKDDKQLMKYSVTDNTLTFYLPNTEKKEEFVLLYANENITLDDYVLVVNVLNEEAISVLRAVSAQSDYWTEDSVYKRDEEKKTMPPVLCTKDNLEECIEKIEEDKRVMCTMDAKLCPDGSYVSRRGPNCEFAPCPGE